jgi:uncharacterized protein (TIGR00369 family)
MITSRTHLLISPEWVGQTVALAEGQAEVRLATRTEMVADDRGLVHGGFTFGLADYAAMLAVNDPHVVMGAAEVRFLAPVTLGETLLATAEVVEGAGKRRLVKCTVRTDRPVFEGTFTCFVLTGHVLDR